MIFNARLPRVMKYFPHNRLLLVPQKEKGFEYLFCYWIDSDNILLYEGVGEMSKSQLWCFILSIQTCVNIKLTHPRCLLLFCFPSIPSSVVFSCPDMRIPVLSNVIRISKQWNLSVSSSRKRERKLESCTSPSVAVTFHQAFADTSRP